MDKTVLNCIIIILIACFILFLFSIAHRVKKDFYEAPNIFNSVRIEKEKTIQKDYRGPIRTPIVDKLTDLRVSRGLENKFDKRADDISFPQPKKIQDTSINSLNKPRRLSNQDLNTLNKLPKTLIRPYDAFGGHQSSFGKSPSILIKKPQGISNLPATGFPK